VGRCRRAHGSVGTVDPRDALDFSGKAVVVTGGTKGLGRVIAETFLTAGAEVLVCARNAPTEPVAAGGREAVFLAADVRDPDQVQAVVDACAERFGSVDVLVNNAGGAPLADSGTVSPRFNEKIVALNLLAPMTFAQAAYRAMQRQDGGGVILNISSVSGLRPNPLGVAYGAAKAGLGSMAQTLAHEWGPAVRVVTVAVGLIVTEDAHLVYGDEAGVAAVGDTLAMKRMGEPSDVADVCLFLASPLARWVTGTTVEVHGGGERPAYLAAATGESVKR
jgi:NAD(P)-dependent dehydrogenase (short-subunit alcohol dehydrogenase family)